MNVTYHRSSNSEPSNMSKTQQHEQNVRRQAEEKSCFVCKEPVGDGEYNIILRTKLFHETAQNDKHQRRYQWCDQKCCGQSKDITQHLDRSDRRLNGVKLSQHQRYDRV